jgi:hypothetical protein
MRGWVRERGGCVENEGAILALAIVAVRHGDPPVNLDV